MRKGKEDRIKSDMSGTTNGHVLNIKWKQEYLHDPELRAETVGSEGERLEIDE